MAAFTKDTANDGAITKRRKLKPNSRYPGL